MSEAVPTMTKSIHRISVHYIIPVRCSSGVKAEFITTSYITLQFYCAVSCQSNSTVQRILLVEYISCIIDLSLALIVSDIYIFYRTNKTCE